MKIGDKILVTYLDGDQLAGRIIGETPKMWNVDFDGEEKTRRIKKSMDIQVIDDPETEEDEIPVLDLTIETKTVKAEVYKIPIKEEKGFFKGSNSLTWKEWAWVIFALGAATVAVLNFLEIIHLGAG